MSLALVLTLPVSASSDPSITGYRSIRSSGTACAGEEVTLLGSGLGLTRPSGEMRYGTDGGSGRTMAWDGVLGWPKVRLPSGMSAATYWLGLFVSGREVTRGPRSLVVESCSTAVTTVAATIPAIGSSDDFEIVSARGGRSGPVQTGPYELRVVVRNNSTSDRRVLVAPAYLDGGVVRVGERGFMRRGDSMTLGLTLDIREDALVSGGSSFSTTVFLVDPEATGGYDRQLFRDRNIANHIKQVVLPVESDNYTVTVMVTAITVHNGCDDIEDLKPWWATLYYNGPELQCQTYANGRWGPIGVSARREGGYTNSSLGLGGRPFDIGTRRTSSPALRFFNVRPGTALPFSFQVMDSDPNAPDDIAASEGFTFSSEQWRRGHTLRFSPASNPGGNRGCPPGTVSFTVQASSVSDRTGR